MRTENRRITNKARTDGNLIGNWIKVNYKPKGGEKEKDKKTNESERNGD